MSKLIISDDLYIGTDFNKRFVRRVESGELDDYDGLGDDATVDITLSDIVKAYLSDGAYVNIDYPGGINQLVKDYRDGKLG